MLKTEEYNFIILEITREMVDNFDFEEIYMTLLQFHEDPESHFDKITIVFRGYDHEEKALNEFPEINEYVKFLDNSFPYWFYYCKMEIPTEMNWVTTLLHCTIFNQPNFMDEPWKNFMASHFNYMNEIMDGLQVPEKVIEERSNLIFQSIKKIFN